MNKVSEAIARSRQERSKRHGQEETEASATTVLEITPSKQRTGEVECEPDEHLVCLTDPGSYEAEQFRRLRHSLEHLQIEKGLKTIAITSPTQGDGKTLVAINLAATLALWGNVRTLLLEADLRQPTFKHRLGLKAPVPIGLAEAATSDRFSLADVVTRLAEFKLDVVAAGEPPRFPSKVFLAPGFQRLMRDAKRDYDYVVLDTPPVLSCTDCRPIGDVVDGFVVVVRAGKTPRNAVNDTLVELTNEKIVGFVFNEFETARRYRRMSYYARFN